MAQNGKNSIALFTGEVEKTKKKFLSTLPEGKSEAEKVFERERGFAIMAARENTKLAACTPDSIYTAVASVAFTGLSLNPALELAYLIPRGGKCCLSPSYKGMIEILLRNKQIKDIRGKVVYENEKFAYSEGTRNDYYIKHQPELNKPDDTKIIAAYSIATYPDGRERFHLMDYKKLMKHKSKAITKNIWNEWEEEMCLKTVIRSHYKYLPKTKQATAVMERFDETNPVDLKTEEKEKEKKDFEDAEIVSDKKQLNEAIEAIENSNTQSELQANIDCYPELANFDVMKKTINETTKRIEKETEKKEDKTEKKNEDQELTEKKENTQNNGKLFQ